MLVSHPLKGCGAAGKAYAENANRVARCVQQRSSRDLLFICTYVRICWRLPAPERGVGLEESHREAERSFSYVIDTCGGKHLDAFVKADVNKCGGSLIEHELAGSSLARVFGTVHLVTKFVASELG